MGSVQGYLYFPEQHNATQTGQESFQSHTAFKGRKTSSCATMPCSASGPWACGRCRDQAAVPPSIAPVFWLWDPQCQPAPHSITAGIQTSPFFMNCFLHLEAETPRVPRINPSMSTLHRAVGVRAACPQELSWGHVSPHEGPWLVPGTAVNAGATFLAAQWHHARLSGGISITSWLSGISTGSTNLS